MINVLQSPHTWLFAAQTRGTECALDQCTLIERGPLILARLVPYLIVVLLLLLGLQYMRQIVKIYKEYRVFREGTKRIIATKQALNNYLAVATAYLPNALALMNSGVALLGASLDKTTKDQLEKALTKTDAIAGEVSAANQVSASQTVNDSKVITTKLQNPFKQQDIMVPVGIAFVVLTIANSVFILAGVYNKSPLRITIEYGYVALSASVIMLLFRYLETVRRNKNLAIRQLSAESRHYQHRYDFVIACSKKIEPVSQEIRQLSEKVSRQPQAKLFYRGQQNLHALAYSLKQIELFADFTATPPLLNISAATKKTISDFLPSATSKEVAIHDDVRRGIVSRAHPEEVRQIVSSLLANAIQFSEDNGRVRVLLRMRLGKIQLRVSDEGEGISTDKLPSLLKPFTNAQDSVQYNQHGAGLNLYIDKIIIEKLGGDLVFQSKLGQGTTAEVSIPLQRKLSDINTFFVQSETRLG